MSDSALPPLYARWLDDLVPGPVRSEPKATCADCVMCVKPDGTRPAAAYAFRPDTKCCTYTPVLPNYLVGRVLLDESPDMAFGRQTMRERIAAGMSVTPIGLARSPALQSVHDQSLNAFGQSLSMRCQHYNAATGGCGIWRHRNGVCATWFCKHERGAVSKQFWSAVSEWLASVERSLARWALLEIGFPVGGLPVWLARNGEYEPGKIDASVLDGQANAVAHASIWGPWIGREEELYIACAQKVNDLTFAQMMAICGPDVALFAEVVKVAHELLQKTDELPARLQLGTFQPLSWTDQGVTVLTYAAFDPVGIPALLLTALHYFDGRPTEDILRALAEERGLELEERLLRAMVDWQLLIPA